MRTGTVMAWSVLALMAVTPAAALAQGGGEKHETDERGVGETSGQPQDEPGQRSEGRGLAPGGYHGSGAGIPATKAGGASRGNSGNEALPTSADDQAGRGGQKNRRPAPQQPSPQDDTPSADEGATQQPQKQQR